MKVSFSGSLTGSSKEFSGENYVNVMPKPGIITVLKIVLREVTDGQIL